MAASDNEVPQPIIIKKVKKGGHGHHGGAWKVAYADFVTAMMAFFLLMWLLNVTTKEQKNAISHYFDPTHPRVSANLSGSGGILGGMTMSPEGAQVSNVQDVAPPSALITPRSDSTTEGVREDGGSPDDTENNFSSENDRSSIDDDGNNLQEGMNILDELRTLEQDELNQLEALVDAQQNVDFEAVKQKIMEEVSKAPELADLMDHLMVDITPEGLRIQIIDKEGRSMFPIGSADMYDFMRKLVAKVTQVVIPQPNQLSIRGHTDGKPYPPGALYNNWNLSADRALASRNAMIAAELPQGRVENVIGKADREHLLPDEPLSPRNRRISIVLLRLKLENEAEIRAAAANAIRKRQEQLQEEKEEQENRQNIPALDQTTQDSMIRIEAEPQDAPPLTEAVEEFDPNTGDVIGDQIDRIRGRNAPVQQAPALPAPMDQDADIPKPQVLEFP